MSLRADSHCAESISRNREDDRDEGGAIREGGAAPSEMRAASAMGSRYSTVEVLGQLGRWFEDTRGAVMTEYTVLLGTVALVSAGALVALGAALVNRFEFERVFILFPFP